MTTVNRPQFQKALKEAADEAGKWYMSTSEKQVALDIEKMTKEQGVTYTGPADFVIVFNFVPLRPFV